MVFLSINSPIDRAEAFARLGRIKLSDTDLDGVLATIATLAKRTVPGATEVSVTLVRENRAHTAAFTGELALCLDESQYASGHGPCLDAAADSVMLSVPEIAAECRWPRWTPRALARGARSSLAIGLPILEAVTGALNLYATTPNAFDDDAISVARTFAEYAAVALANANLCDTNATLAQHMRTAMDSRAVIEQAKGIIMADRRCTAEEAFGILSKISQDTNRKLRDVATALVAQAPANPGQVRQK
ncbi:GAF and ANTAR domain-containing protein [Actinoplanes sp. NPDC049118]|uniref:GAF and ANTAR domain-containing protein n=1 Tax=Actinoplanes sp. NPDC049118 TaxID=3155769 RepID=UPI0033E5FDEA